MAAYRHLGRLGGGYIKLKMATQSKISRDCGTSGEGSGNWGELRESRLCVGWRGVHKEIGGGEVVSTGRSWG